MNIESDESEVVLRETFTMHCGHCGLVVRFPFDTMYLFNDVWSLHYWRLCESRVNQPSAANLPSEL
jgi:hypothetical protein